MQLVHSQTSVSLSEESLQRCVDVCLDELDCANDWYVTDIFDFLQLVISSYCKQSCVVGREDWQTAAGCMVSLSRTSE